MLRWVAYSYFDTDIGSRTRLVVVTSNLASRWATQLGNDAGQSFLPEISMEAIGYPSSHTCSGPGGMHIGNDLIMHGVSTSLSHELCLFKLFS